MLHAINSYTCNVKRYRRVANNVRATSCGKTFRVVKGKTPKMFANFLCQLAALGLHTMHTNSQREKCHNETNVNYHQSICCWCGCSKRIVHVCKLECANWVVGDTAASCTIKRAVIAFVMKEGNSDALALLNVPRFLSCDTLNRSLRFLSNDVFRQ